MRKFTLILTLALLIIALAAGTALAAASNIWVDGVEIVKNSVPTPSSGWPNGVSYDQTSNTLTLDGATIDETFSYNWYKDWFVKCGIIADGELNILLKNENIIDLTNLDGGYAIRAEHGAVKISGPGSLDIKRKIGPASGYGITINNNALAIEGCKLNLTGGRDAISANEMIIKDSILTFQDMSQFGIDPGELSIENSELTFTRVASGINCNSNLDISITNSMLNMAVNGYAGISANEDILIKDSWVKIEGGTRGISTGGVLTIDNSYVYAEGSVAAIFAKNKMENSDYSDPNNPGIILKDVFVKQGGKQVQVWGRSWIDGATIDRQTGLLSYGETVSEDEDEDEGEYEDEYEDRVINYTFSETHQRIMEEWSDSEEEYIYPGISQIVELVPLAEMMELAVPILGGVGKNFPFVDVGLNHWAYQDIFDAFKKGLINGKTATLYLPDGPLTYAEAIKLAACIHQLNAMGAVSFEASDLWYQTYVSYAELNEIINKGEFAGKYNDAIIRYDFAHIFGKALPASAFTPINSIDNIPDVPSSNRHADEILMLYRAGILVGSDAVGNFNGNSNIKRSEVAAIVVRMIDPDKRIRK